MRKINIGELVEEPTNENVRCWLSWDGTYRLTYTEEDGREIELVRGLKTKVAVYEFLLVYELS